MSIRAIIHDWDDTITNSFQTYGIYFEDFAKHFGLDRPQDNLRRQFWGQPLDNIINGLWPQLNPSKIEKMTKQFFNHLGQVNKSYLPRPFPKIKSTFQQLKNNGLYLGVISSSPRDQVELIYKKFIDPNLSFHQFIFCREDVTTPKPDPRVFDQPLDRLQKLGISPDETIYIGDNLIDYFVARDRGIRFYAVTTGLHTSTDFIASGLTANLILSSFPQILEKIK